MLFPSHLPLDLIEIRLIIQKYQSSIGCNIPKFWNPGESWYTCIMNAFCQHHKEQLIIRKCQNVKSVRGAVGPNQIISIFDHLDGIFPYNILTFDETRFSDDTGVKKRSVPSMDLRFGEKHEFI